MIKKEIAKDKSLEELLVLADELARGYFRQGAELYRMCFARSNGYL